MNNDAATSISDDPLDGIVNPDLHGVGLVDGRPLVDDRRDEIRSQQTKRATFLDDFIRNLDIMIYCELSALYYLDCSLFRFFLRSLPQFFYFTPKPAFFPSAPPNRPYIAVIILSNTINILLHTISAAPDAGEAMRGYIHGALLIDFIGELGPISKTRMVLLDLIIMALQFVILAVVLEREELKKSMEGSLASAPSLNEEEAGPRGQDHDAEEQGIHRSLAGEAGDIEMQPLRSTRPETGNDYQGSEMDTFIDLPLTIPGSSASEHPLDTFNSGQYIIANLHISETIRVSYRRWLNGGVGIGAIPGPNISRVTARFVTPRQRSSARTTENAQPAVSI
ncbi:hypothetical protein MMC26_003116 [Xylographa opegraphella]|nr:hypothetical protein [Xylographa opegraphella]